MIWESSETAVTIPGRGRHTLESLGWSDAVRTYRPFLSYKELSTMVEGRPVDRYNELAPMLGMESLQEPVESLRRARLQAQNSLRTAKDRVAAAVATLTAHSQDGIASASPDGSTGSASAATSHPVDAGSESMPPPDERVSLALEALRGDWQLDTVEGLVVGSDSVSSKREELLTALEQMPVPDFEQSVAAAENLREATSRLGELRGGDGERARKLVGLLQAAVEMHEQHGDADCPVCGTIGGLHRTRVVELRREIGRLRRRARAFEESHRMLQDARHAAKQLVGAIPEVLRTLDSAEGRAEARVDVSQVKAAWEAWVDTPDSDTDLAEHLESACLLLADASESIRSHAASAHQELRRQWRPIAAELAEVLPVAREGQRAERLFKPLQQAERWLKKCASDIRCERFEAVKTQVKAIWNVLAVGSNVNLEDVRLGARRVDMDVTVDGSDGSALGVMSQGELNCLALSLFIPRARFDESPFRFAVIDDPVQAMDPVRVDGLAKVLDHLAETRQVVVFTHDNRLPDTLRRLQIPTAVLTAARRPGSLLELKKTLNPTQAAVEDARAVQLSSGLPEEVPRRVVPNLCRQAIEAACLESGRRKLLASGLDFSECDKQWTNAERLLPRIAISLYGDADRAGDVLSTLRNKFGGWAVKTVQQCNRQTHTGASYETDLKDLINRTESLAQRLAGP